jgi:cold shock CspA family protein
MYELKEGQRVEFEVEDTERGPRATGVTILE